MRGIWGGLEHGVNPGFVKSVPTSGADNYNPNGNNAVVGRWLITPGQRSGDNDAPVLYWWPAVTGKDCRQENMYVPHTSGPTYQTETQWEASLRLQRMSLEAILNANLDAANEHPEATISPWIPILGSHTDDSLANLSESECRDQLAMLYAKGLQTLLVWGSTIPNIGIGTDWTAFKGVYNSVYSVYISADAVLNHGTIVSGSGLHKERIWDTLRRWVSSAQAEYTIKATSAAVSSVHQTSIDVEFSGLRDSGGALRGNWMRVYLESQATPEGGVDDYCVGKIYAKQGSGWVQLVSDDFGLGDPRNGCYGLFTPDQYTRRNFDFPLATAFVGTDGKLTLRFVHISLPVTSVHTSSAFTSTYDLTQVVPFTKPNNDLPPGGDSLVGGGGYEGELGEMVGADYNYDGQVLDGDADAFMDDYLDSKPAADYNIDGDIDTADVADFLTDFIAAHD